MAQVLSQVETRQNHDAMLLSQDHSDDAGVYQITDDIALVQTVDYFTPVVDDPYIFGQIAAANALSDVYAMGAEVKTALNIVGFSVKKYGANVLAQILQGAEDKVFEAGGAIIGGHSIDDDEPKFGLSVTGVAHPDHLYSNGGAQSGDVLVLTKPIGIGIATTAIKRGTIKEQTSAEAIYWMSKLNKEASLLLKDFDVQAVTDVTGFGLLGHALEIAKASAKTLTVFQESVPIISGVKDLVQQGSVPGGSKANLEWLKEDLNVAKHISEEDQLILADAITSGGLLISINKEDSEAYIERLNQIDGQYATIIGEVNDLQSTYLKVR